MCVCACVCQGVAAGGEEAAGGSHLPAGGGARGGAGKHGAPQRPLQKEQHTGEALHIRYFRRESLFVKFEATEHKALLRNSER